MQWIRSHLSFANSISLIALFVALGGTSLAAVTLTKNSVGAKQIKKDAVTASEVKRNAVGASELRSNAVASGDIADNGVGGADLADNSVGGSELSDNSVGGGELANNSVGSAEVTDGSLGENDLQPGLLEHTVTVQRTDVATVADNSTGFAEAICPDDQQAIGGGASVEQTAQDDVQLIVSRPGNGGLVPTDGQEFANTWRVGYRNITGGTATATIRAFVLCADIP